LGRESKAWRPSSSVLYRRQGKKPGKDRDFYLPAKGKKRGGWERGSRPADGHLFWGGRKEGGGKKRPPLEGDRDAGGGRGGGGETLAEITTLSKEKIG